MAKILIAGAGGAPSEGVINSLLAAGRHEVVGMGSEPSDLVLSHAARKYVVPYANDPGYRAALLKVLGRERPDLIHFQNDLEVYHASLLRDEIHAAGTKTFMPPHDVIETCVDKWKSYLRFRAAGVKVPDNVFLNDPGDLERAFDELGDRDGRIWIRKSGIGAGGAGSIPTNDRQLAKCWIDRQRGWGDFVAARMLTSKTVTWLSIWHEGELVVAQTRRRTGWIHGSRAPSGVTGVTKVGETCSDPAVHDIAQRAVRAVSDRPHGIFGVDMAYDEAGVPNPTEINISRFFTTVLFFTRAGLNLPEIFVDLGLTGERPNLARALNPLPDGLLWLRGMDTPPRLMRREDIDREVLVP